VQEYEKKCRLVGTVISGYISVKESSARRSCDGSLTFQRRGPPVGTMIIIDA
jgi:hypothetical protein